MSRLDEEYQQRCKEISVALAGYTEVQEAKGYLLALARLLDEQTWAACLCCLGYGQEMAEFAPIDDMDYSHGPGESL